MNNIEEINGFNSLNEFNRFEKWLQNEILNLSFSEVPVQQYYCGVNFQERWFKVEQNGELWRLVYPDFPFTGYWGLVSDD